MASRKSAQTDLQKGYSKAEVNTHYPTWLEKLYTKYNVDNSNLLTLINKQPYKTMSMVIKIPERW